MKTALIIGVTGQDGAYLAKLLLGKGYKVIGITRNTIDPDVKNLAFLGISNDIEFVELVSLDQRRIEKIVQKYTPDEIYNLSAQSSVGESFKIPIDTVSFNTISVLSWLEAIKSKHASAKFYQASSSEMFGNVSKENLPLRESLIFHPASPYGVSKAAAHWLTVNYRESHQLFAACGILFNHESCLRGPNYVVKKLVHAALELKLGLRQEPIMVGNLSIKRDWGYAPKYVEAMWLMLQNPEADDFLICSGNVISLHELVKLIFNELELDFEKYIQVDPNLFRPVDLDEIYGDNTKAKKELNWEYEMSNANLVSKLISDEMAYIEWEQKR